MLETLIQYTSHTGENIRVTLKATPMPIPFVAYMGADKNLLDLLTEHYWTDITLTFETSKKTYTYQIDGYTNSEELQAYKTIPQLLQQQIKTHADFKTLHQAALDAILPLRYTPQQEDYLPGPEWNPPNWHNYWEE